MFCYLPSAISQSQVIESKVVAELKLEKEGENVALFADIFDGFAYKFPFTLRTESEYVNFHGLVAEPVCKCAQIRFAKNILTKNSNAVGEIFVLPKLGELVEGVLIHGYKPIEDGPEIGEKETVACGIALKVKVLKPVKLSDGFLIVEDGKFKKNEVKIEIAEGILVKSVTGSCTEQQVKIKVLSDVG